MALDTEAKVSAALMRHLRTYGVLPPSYVVDRIENRVSVGHPDIVATGNRLTSWWETKLADPKIRHRGVQRLKMRRLARAGVAFYIVYFDDGGELSTHIVPPDRITEWPHFRGEWTHGFEHDFVARSIIHAHRQFGSGEERYSQ